MPSIGDPGVDEILISVTLVREHSAKGSSATFLCVEAWDTDPICLRVAFAGANLVRSGIGSGVCGTIGVA